MPTFKQALTSDERERLAYITGHTQFAELCEFESQVEDLCSAATHLDEARGGFIDEDFAATHLQDLRQFSKRLRGDNRAELERIITELEETRDEAARSAEYSLEELGKAASLLA